MPVFEFEIGVYFKLTENLILLATVPVLGATLANGWPYWFIGQHSVNGPEHLKKKKFAC